jgi:hypothetical protein
MTDTVTEKSLCELMDEGFRLSLKLAHEDMSPDGTYLTPRKSFDIPETNVETIYGWADGLVHKRYHTMATGRCSHSQIANFDIAKFEASVKMDIRMMTDALALMGEPKRLTPEEMRARGYVWN